MDTIKTLAYAGLGLAKQTNDKLKIQFDELVEAGKKADTEGKNLVGDFFKTIDSTKEDLENQIAKTKTKLEETFPFIKDMEESINKKSEEMRETVKETFSKAKETISKVTTNESSVEDATIVEETK
jgi:polyhydroxyalkanoate synthesis regulator phasin